MMMSLLTLRVILLFYTLSGSSSLVVLTGVEMVDYTTVNPVPIHLICTNLSQKWVNFGHDYLFCYRHFYPALLSSTFGGEMWYQWKKLKYSMNQLATLIRFSSFSLFYIHFIIAVTIIIGRCSSLPPTDTYRLRAVSCMQTLSDSRPSHLRIQLRIW